MAPPRVVPWSSPEEWEQLKKWFYSNSATDQRRAILKVNSYQCKGSQYLPHVIDSTCQLTNALLLDSNNTSNDTMNVRLSYTMSLIRFVNGILDPNQKAQFAIPLHTIARKVGLSSWFVELRHWGTHERELPSLDMLRIAVRDALNWLWIHYWDDAELEESESEEDEEDGELQFARDETYYSGVDIRGLRVALKEWDEVDSLFKENKKVWISLGDDELQLKRIISSDNFMVESTKSQTQGPHRKQLKIEKEISDHIELWKEAWQSSDEKSKFIEYIMNNHFHSTLLSMLISQLEGFSTDYFQWVVTNYSLIFNGVKGDTIPSIFKNFREMDELFKYLIKRYLKLVSIKKIISQYDIWMNILTISQNGKKELKAEKPLSFMVKFIKLVQSKYSKYESQDDWRNSKQKKRKLNNNKTSFIDYQNRLKTEIETFLRDYIEHYDLIKEEALERIKYQDLMNPQPLTKKVKLAVPTTTGPSFTEETKHVMNPLDILNDLKLLKSRMDNTTQTKVSTSPKNNIKRWTKPIDWTPKPFGVL